MFARCVCVCVCVIYASHTQDYRWRPSTGSHSRGMWVCYSHPGPCNPRLESYWEQVYKAPPPHPHQHNIPPPDRTNYTRSTTPCQKTSSHYLTTRLQRLYTLSAQWYFCCERRIRGSEGLITHLVLFVFIFLPYFIIQSRAPALATSYPKKTFNRIRPIHLLYTDGWMLAVYTSPLISGEETPDAQNRVGFECRGTLLWLWTRFLQFAGKEGSSPADVM